MVVEAVQRSNNNVGGNVVEQSGQWTVIRGIGLIQSVADVENVVIGSSNGTPIYVRNVAEVKVGNAFRTGALDKNGKEAVGGVVIARYGVNTLEVIERVKQRIEALQVGLPKGVRIGEGSVVSADAVVTSDVPPYTMVAGNPARRVSALTPPTSATPYAVGQEQIV